MKKCFPVFFMVALLSACGEQNNSQVVDSVKDSVAGVEVPQFDISGEFEALFLKSPGVVSSENGMRVLTVENLRKDDSLFFLYKAANPCAECHVEIQIWRNEKYIDVVRDTGFGGEKMYIPAWQFIDASKFGTPEYERLSIYMSVRQFHPVETGNKRFLFYLDLK